MTWVVWAVFAGTAGGLGLAGYHLSLRTVRVLTAWAAVALAVVVTSYGLRHPAAGPSDLAHGFSHGADRVATALLAPLWPGHDVPAPGRPGWIAIAILVLVGYRELEAWTLCRQAPVLDTSRLGDDPFAAEVRFRLSAIQVRSPSLLPGGSRSGMLATIAESSGVAGAGLAGAIIRFAGAVWPTPRRHRLQTWIEPGAGTGPGKVTVELTDVATGTAAATKTVTAANPGEAATMVAGYVARHVFEQDRATPAWCYGAADGHDLAVAQLARQERTDVAATADMDRSRLRQIAILRRIASAERCAGLVRYELAQLHDLGGDTVSALRLHAMNREQYPRFFRGRYRLAMSLEMITNPGFAFTDRDAVADLIDQILGHLRRCGLTPIDRCPPDGVVARDGGWVLSRSLNTILLAAAHAELLAIRRQLTVRAVTWAMLRHRDERTTWRPHRKARVRQGFRDGADAGLLLVAVRQRLNGDALSPGPLGPLGWASRRWTPGRALRIADAITGDSDPIRTVLTKPMLTKPVPAEPVPAEPVPAEPVPMPDGRSSPGPAPVLRDRVRWLPWLRRTLSWQAAYNVACVYSALAQQGLACEEQIVTSLRRAIGNQDSEMERGYDWISHDPDFAPLRAAGAERYPAFVRFLAEQRLLDYPDRELDGSQPGGQVREVGAVDGGQVAGRAAG